ncbi:MAG: phosphotransferase, partial [Pseudomonadota bacterium]|nr:phosphotransferase [Pseudomonadota bacterium]
LQSWPTGLPSGHIHADMFPNNVLFVGDRLTGIIDFYFACQDIYAYDIAVCLNSWCFDADGSFNVTKSGAILQGYESQRPLLDAEKQALPILNQGAAMRFFLTRLYDWINTPKDALVKPLNPLEYWSRLRFHQRAKGPESYGLWH